MSADNSLNISGAGDGFLPSTSHPHRSSKAHECVTRCDPLILSQLWKIENFHSVLKLSQPGMCLRSQVFRDMQMPDACWQLCLYPNGKREENKDNVSLFLKMSATTPAKEVKVKAEYRFYFLDDSDEPRFSNVNIGDFHAKPPKGGHSWGLRNIPKQKVASAVRRDNSLLISCIIELMPEPSRIVCKRITSNPVSNMEEVSSSHVQEELELLRTGEGADFAIEVTAPAPVCQTMQTPVHSHKLRAHSSVFRAMLSHEHTREVKERVIRMENVNPIAVRLMLEYMYCGKLVSEVKWEMAIEVMILAEKYDIADLKTCCEHVLTLVTNKENVCQVLPLADSHNAQTLLQHCHELVLANKGITRTDTWRRFRDLHPNLAAIVLEKVLEAEQSPPPMKRSRI